MTDGKEAFESAAEIGVGKSYNNKQFAQIFKGIRASIEDAAAEAGRDPIVDEGTPGALPPTEYPDPDYPELQPGDIWIDANGGLNFYYNGQWNQVKVYTKNVLPNDDSPLRIITPNGETFDNQREYNEWIYTRTDRQPIHSDTPPTVHPDFPAYELRDGDYWIDYNNHLYYWNDTKQAWVPIAGSNARTAIYSATPPTLHPDYDPPEDELVPGDTWYDIDNYFKQYVYNGTDWILVTNYVSKEGGDSMEGPLVITGDRDGNADNPWSTLIALNIDSGQNSDLQLRHNGDAKVYVGKESISVNPKVILSGNEIRYKSNGTKVVSDETNRENLTLNKNGIFYRGEITADEHLITKGYSDLEDQVLDAKVTELRVELDALAPIDAAGVYRWQEVSSPRPPSVGQFVLLNDDLTQTVDQYGESGGVWIHQTDWNGVAIDFANVHIGELIQLFDRYEPEFVLGEITDVQDNNIMPDYSGSLIIRYTRIASEGGPDYGSGADPLVNFKVYRKPTDDGTGASAYLPIKGGTMEGNIVMDANKIRFNAVNESTDHIHFTRETGEFARLLRLDHPGPQEFGGYEIRVGGNTNYNALRLMGGGNSDEVIVQMKANGRLEIFRTLFLQDQKITGLIHATEDSDAVNLGQIKEALSELRDEFLKDLIAGVWKSDNFTGGITSTGQGCFASRYDNGAQAAVTFAEVTLFRFWYEDEGGISVEWDNWDPGEIITLRQIDDPGVTATYRIKTAPTVNGNIRNIEVEYINSQKDSNLVFQFGERYAVTLTEFSDGFNGNDLDSLYLRLDGSNDPIKDELNISTGDDTGAGALILTGRRTGTSNNAGAIAFKNANFPGYTGYFGWKCDNNGRWFNVSDDIDLNSNGLHSCVRVRFPHNLPFSIESKDGGTTHQRMICRFPANANEGNAAIQFDRYPTNVRRGFAFRGKVLNDSGNRVDGDLLWSYLNNSDDDAVNYSGKTSGDTNIQTKASVQALINTAYTLDEEGDVHFYDHRLEDVGDPVVDNDAATKGYVDTSIEEALENIDVGGGDYAPSNHVHSQYHASENSSSILLANHTKISQSTFASSSHSHSGYASSSHNHNTSYVKGNYTISKTNGIFYIS